MNQYTIWMEGYSATGESAPASILGYAKGENFTDAVKNFKNENPKHAEYIDLDRLTYWGCKLFNTESQARRGFG